MIRYLLYSLDKKRFVFADSFTMSEVADANMAIVDLHNQAVYFGGRWERCDVRITSNGPD